MIVWLEAARFRAASVFSTPCLSPEKIGSLKIFISLID